jgi:formylglycine-generating enzyme required for sulfatase activity/tRNA A-37 threonylcarbamoyl transferase component Bud32
MNPADTTSLQFQQSLEVLRQVDEACATFERALRCGELLHIEEILAAAAPDARQQLLRELLTLEMEHRANNGESPSLDEFRQRFPNQAPLVKYLYLEHFVPVRLADFSVQRLLGRGAYGHVYQGWDAKLTRNVAIKVFRRDPMEPATRGGSLLAEARTVAQLRHPGIVTVYGIDKDDDGDEFLVLEYVDGKSLEDLLRGDRMAPQEAARLLLDVVHALQHAHQQGLIHRDLKPANILLDAAHRPRVTDFGLALHMATSRRRRELAGTLAYMAPEQASGETHRLDGRTDLWAVGVILYRMLAGKLPFSGDTQQEFLEAIRYAEPQDLGDVDPLISPELSRIAHRCLAKRMNERYQSAADVADDLTAFVSSRTDVAPAGRASHEAVVAVVPKGLRCFDADDRDFFLALVPGPRDRNGVPSAVLFWQRHLQETDAHATFRVGLLYGPSGCGKSSLVRAGILPRLPQNVKAIVVEGTGDETELVLIRELRRRFPDISNDLTLPEVFRELREGAYLAPGEKLVVVFDQFEQWLHGWHQNAIAQLVEALRQCDGGRVQALILVRDDFWMPATRLFQQLDVPLVEGFNASAVDLFDRTHATKVLAAFGVAYGQLDDQSWQQTQERTRFLARAVDELAEDGWIVPVRLCIFAEMIKARPWSPATLQEVGGAQGLGTAFLEEVFDGRSASPMYRLHRKAARRLLERLLPPPGTDIRGHLVVESELRAVSGYDQRPADFAGLLRCLDHELRLITPSDTELEPASDYEPSTSDQASPRLYQLTHDFLVSAIRGWLNQSRRGTLRGRAELRLAEYADAYSARPETRQLPSWWEWLSVLVLTRPGRWRSAEKAMMHRATRRHMLRSAFVVGTAILVGVIVYDRMAAVHADGLVEAVATSDSRDLPQAVARLTEYQRWTRPRLLERLGTQPQDPEQHVRILLGLLAVGEPDTDELTERLLDADPPLAVAIANVLSRYGNLPDLESRLWTVAADDRQAPGARLRASVALAQLDPDSRVDKWPRIADTTAMLLLRDISENPGHFNTWVDVFAPARNWLVGPFRKSFADLSRTEAERLLAATVLAQYLAGDVPELIELAMQSTPKQFEVFAGTLGKRAEAECANLSQVAKSSIPTEATEDEKDRLARRQANAILLLRQFGEDQLLWPALRHVPDPRIRSFLIDHLRQVLFAPEQFAQHLSDADPGIRQAIVLVLGAALSSTPATETRGALVESLLRTYRDDADPGVHSAAEWSLRRLGASDMLEQALSRLSTLGMRPGYGWYVTKSGITMIIFEGPGPVQLGSPESEPGRDASDEAAWTFNLDWSFAISATEITQAQYHELCPEYEKFLNEHAPQLNSPANAVTWPDAIGFCRKLSERDGIVESEMVIPPVDDIKKGPYVDFVGHSGYRLPVEVEWEVACRAGALTPRHFGYAPDLLSQYACYIANSGGHAWAVGSGFPNQAGLFDMLGNVAEWCYDKFEKHPELRPERIAQARGFGALANYAIRGNEYSSDARIIRSANRRFAPSNDPNYSRGFRIAHTLRAMSE